MSTAIDRKCWMSLLVAIAAFSNATAHAGSLAHPLFQDHAVLQRGEPIVVWGTARRDEQVTVSIGKATVTGRADASGRWTATLPAMTAGGPYSIAVRGSSGASQSIDDVLIGDVWLCSGQSNMVLPVHRALDARSEIASSANDALRLLAVPIGVHALPQDAFAAPVQWEKAGPTTVPEFSAACLYFARELQKTAQVPMGLIAAAWGGSKIETWMSQEALRATGRYDAGLETLDLYARDQYGAYARWGGQWQAWWNERVDRASQPWSTQPRGQWRVAPNPLEPWERWGMPALASYNGMLWYRTRVKLTAEQAAQGATLSLGTVDEIDQTWINGKPIGADVRDDAQHSEPVAGVGPERTYRLPRGSLRAGENVIVVNVLDTYAFGGLYGPAEKRVLRFDEGAVVPLDGEWRYQLPPSNVGMPPRAPWNVVAGLGMIYNGTIVPLGHPALRGVVWYQGESNTDDAARYEDLLTRFIADWRRRFGKDLAFLIVQLANFGQPPTAPTESAWAELREAQRRVVARDLHAGLAVAVDIGDRYDIHPSNKQEVGRRLARAAQRVVYGEAVTTGPRPLDARKQDAAIVVSFADVNERLIAYSAGSPIGFELCNGAPGSCRYAQAELRGTAVVLRADVPAPTRVRYCWADSAVCTLFDSARLPAVPFEIEVQ